MHSDTTLVLPPDFVLSCGSDWLVSFFHRILFYLDCQEISTGSIIRRTVFVILWILSLGIRIRGRRRTGRGTSLSHLNYRSYFDLI